MLGKKNKNETSGFAADTGATSTIIPKTRITGTFQSEGNIRLDGELEGKILCKGKVVIGPGGVGLIDPRVRAHEPVAGAADQPPVVGPDELRGLGEHDLEPPRKRRRRPLAWW